MKVLFTSVLFFFISTVCSAQMPAAGGSSKRIDKKLSFVPIPYLSYDRSQGFQFGALPMFMYNPSKKDTISPSSISGGLAMYTTNNTWFGMVFNKWYLREDKYRLSAAAGLGNFNFQFYWDNSFSPGFIDYSTGTAFTFLEIQRKVASNLYMGVHYIFARLNTNFETVIENDPNMQTDLNGIGFVSVFDKRNDVYYPNNGYLFNIAYNTFPGFINENNSNKVEVDLDFYCASRQKKDVIASRVYVGVAVGQLDFNQQFIVGNRDIRGYSQGVFRGDQIISIQGEYRWNLTNKYGMVGFFGSAMIFNGINENDNEKLLPGAGAGFRFNVFPENHMNIGIDAAVGIEDWSVSFQIGEAF